MGDPISHSNLPPEEMTARSGVAVGGPISITLERAEAEWLLSIPPHELDEISEEDWSGLQQRVRAALNSPQPSREAGEVWRCSVHGPIEPRRWDSEWPWEDEGTVCPVFLEEDFCGRPMTPEPPSREQRLEGALDAIRAHWRAKYAGRPARVAVKPEDRDLYEAAERFRAALSDSKEVEGE